ncbi:MAG: helix-turn-helix transcriptional regulator [Propionibacteriaceae bacterium]|jgi:hypothetical protein|nr:helix-turn-helix transcriptional regulator [Propionibacteriaceae bacterium]
MSGASGAGRATLRLKSDTVLQVMWNLGIRSQRQLAAEVGVSLPTVKRALSGRHAPESALTAGLSRRLGLTFDELLEAVPREVVS